MKHSWGRVNRQLPRSVRRPRRPNTSRVEWRRVYRARMDVGLEICRLCRLRPATRFGHLIADSAGGSLRMGNTTLSCGMCEQVQDNRTVHGRSLAVEEAAATPDRRWSQLGLPAALEGRDPPVPEPKPG